MTFAWPIALVGLVAVPLLALLYVAHERRRAKEVARFANPALLPAIVDRSPSWRRHLPTAVVLLALAAMVMGVARPQATIDVPREEATVIVAIDTSRSMTATDVNPTRLDAARLSAERFVAAVPKQFRIAVIAFGSRSIVALPPTTDRSLVDHALSALRPGEGTALGDAVALGARLVQRERHEDGTVLPAAMLLVSDGASQGGRTTPAAAARRAAAQAMPVYSLGVGTPAGVVTVTLPGGLQQIIRVPPSPATLRRLAQQTGGRFFTAADDPGLADVYEHLGSRLGSRSEPREITDFFAGGAAVLLVVAGGLSMLWFRRVL